MFGRDSHRQTLWGRIGLLTIMLFSAAGTIHAQQPDDQASTDPTTAKSFADINRTSQQSLKLQQRSRYQLHLSDVLGLGFPLTPEFDQTVTVQPDGYVALRGAGSIRVVGHTLAEATAMLRNAYAKILHDPIITVELREFEKPYFIVGGEVGHSGKFDLRGDTSVVEALEIAGGMKDSAKRSDVLLFHRTEGGWALAKSVNVKKLLQEGNLEEVSYLQPGDFLYVPKNAFSKIARFLPSTSLGAYLNPNLLH